MHRQEGKGVGAVDSYDVINDSRTVYVYIEGDILLVWQSVRSLVGAQTGP